MNRYLIKGLSLTISGILCVYFSYILMGEENNWYKLLMTIGVILFGWGFITLVYRIFRKIDRDSILDDRHNKKK